MSIINATTETFEQLVLKSDKPVLVDFWAPWCGPCKMIAPTLERLSEERNDVVIVKVNIDEYPDLAPAYNVRSIPTLILFKGGVVKANKIGALSANQLNQFLSANI